MCRLAPRVCLPPTSPSHSCSFLHPASLSLSFMEVVPPSSLSPLPPHLPDPVIEEAVTAPPRAKPPTPASHWQDSATPPWGTDLLSGYRPPLALTSRVYQGPLARFSPWLPRLLGSALGRSGLPGLQAVTAPFNRDVTPQPLPTQLSGHPGEARPASSASFYAALAFEPVAVWWCQPMHLPPQGPKGMPPWGWARRRQERAGDAASGS